MKKKKEDYGFLHFGSIEDKDKFTRDIQGKKFVLNSENNVSVQFFPVKRNETRKSDTGSRGAFYNLYDNGTYFTILISLLISDKTKLELFTDDEDFLIISGEYKEIDFDGETIKRFIPQGNFEFKIQLPSRIDTNNKVKIEKIDELDLYKIELKKADTNKRRKLLFE